MKTFLITGATSGIGEACARRCLEQGDQVVAICRDLAKAHLKFDADIVSGKFVPLEYDLSCSDELYKFCASNLKQFKIDRFIHCAGFSLMHNVTSVKYKEMIKHYEVGVFSLMEIVKSLLRSRKKEQELSILALSSVASTFRLVSNGAYGMTKNSIEFYVQVLNKQINAEQRRLPPDADDLAKADLITDIEQREKALIIAKAKAGLLIRINALAPSLILTPMINYDALICQGIIPPLIPLEVVLNEIFLIIENKYMSGQTIVLNNDYY